MKIPTTIRRLLCGLTALLAFVSCGGKESLETESPVFTLQEARSCFEWEDDEGGEGDDNTDDDEIAPFSGWYFHGDDVTAGDIFTAASTLFGFVAFLQALVCLPALRVLCSAWFQSSLLKTLSLECTKSNWRMDIQLRLSLEINWHRYER